MGQIATFIEGLHLSYKDVWERIPYRNLVMMQKDKLHEVYGDIVKETSGADMFAKRGGK